MSKYFDYHPDTGIHETQHFDEDSGRVSIHQQEDVSLLLDQIAERRNCRQTDAGIKKNFWHYATIPMTQVLELRRKGIDVFDKNDGQALWRELNTNLPYLKLTDKTHA